MGVGNLFARPGYREFFFDIATNPKTRHLTHVSRLDVGASTVATNLGLKFGDCYYHVLASYDRESEIAKYGPGAAHLHDLMRYAIGLGYRKFDFSVGDERYKYEWCDSELKLFDYTSAETLRGACMAVPVTAARTLKRKIKQNPALWRAFRKARAFVGSMRKSRH
jgi:CelD/BcsL family acetyltransferase involved in cellulose biosynthesis